MTSASTSRLVADIGGTNARFGWQPAPGAPVGSVQTLAVRDHPDLLHALRHYLAALPAGTPLPGSAAFAVATAVQGDEISFTNSPWRFNRAQLQQALGLDRLLVLNDFEALALSLPDLDPQHQLQALPQGHARPLPHLPLAVIGPGTGLGVGIVIPHGPNWLALPSEGGHSTMAPADELESQVLSAVRRECGHVSAERVLSGTGLPYLHRALAQVHGEPVPAADAKAIVEASERGDAQAIRTVDLFCAMLGGFAGNVALLAGARGGVFVGGGIVPRLGERFMRSRFRECFEAKGRFQAYLAEVPTLLITDTLAALSGAAAALGRA